MKAIHTDDAPKAVGPYSQAIVCNGFVFASGQIALNPQTMEMVEGGIEAQTKQVLHNMKQVVEAAGSDIKQIVKTTVFLKNIADYPKMNELYEAFFGDHKPARSALQVAALPKDALVEIECIAKLY